MKHDYSQQTIAMGRDSQQRHQETPNTFGTLNNAEIYQQQSQLDKPKQRMAGRVGQRAIDYMTDPEEQQRTNRWMEAVGMSNEGMQFNQAKMMGGMPMPQE